jgi:hypothetical protein
VCRPRQAAAGSPDEVVEVTTAFEVFTYGRAFRPASFRAAWVEAEGTMRLRVRSRPCAP